MQLSSQLVVAAEWLDGIFWGLTYLFIIWRGLKDKSYGMPIVALCGNIAWEIIFGLGILKSCPTNASDCNQSSLIYRNIAVMLLDFGVLYTILRFGKAQFFQPKVKKYLYPLILVGIVSAASLILTTAQEFYIQSGDKFVSVTTQSGMYTGFGLAVMMSILFNAMIVSRGNLNGQSLYIAMFKLLGDVFAYVSIAGDGINSPLINVMFVIDLLFNALYAWQVYKMSKELNINPFKRF